MLFDRFTIDKIDETKEFKVNLAVLVNLDDKSSSIPVFTDTRIPIPLCNDNFSLTDFGVHKISELADSLGTHISQAGIDWVLVKLGIKVTYYHVH